MAIDRRCFIKSIGLTGLGTAAFGREPGNNEQHAGSGTDQAMGVLVDLPNCIGCRKCEYACQEAAGFEVPPIEAYSETSVFAAYRRPGPRCYTTVNEFQVADNGKRAIYTKSNCLHCLEPACASACLVGALRRQPDGAVTYDASKCMGCRYCMVACPFQIPTYDYDDPLTPQVRKCTFCHGRTTQNGTAPACVKICPNEALIWGKRSELLSVAHDRIRARPDRYVDHIYGEHEAGGTSWLYLSSVPFEQLGFLELGSTSPAKLTEAIQHGVFKFFVPPLALYALLGIIMRVGKAEPETESRKPRADSREGEVDHDGRAPFRARFANRLARRPDEASVTS